MSSHTNIPVAELSGLLHKAREAIAEARNARVERAIDEEISARLFLLPEPIKRLLKIKPLTRDVAYKRFSKRGDSMFFDSVSKIKRVGWGAERACKGLQALCDLSPSGEVFVTAEDARALSKWL